MAKATFHDRLVAGLTSRGYRIVDGGGRYTKFTRSDLRSKSTGKSFYIFVGPNGALRAGVNVTDSRSIGEPARQSTLYIGLLTDGDAALAMQKLGVTNPAALDF